MKKDKPEQKYFYVIKYKDSVPNYVYPEFIYLYDIMKTPTPEEQSFGRILVQ